jgi:hypothetical protein
LVLVAAAHRAMTTAPPEIVLEGRHVLIRAGEQ